jgi:hypothetical protein
MFCLEDGQTVPHIESITLCTARVLAAELQDGNAFVKMLHEIVRTEPADYGTLIGRSFNDRLAPVRNQRKEKEE